MPGRQPAAAAETASQARAGRAIALKPGFGPTAGELLGAGFARLGGNARKPLAVAAVFLAAIFIAAVAILANRPLLSGGQLVRFSFSHPGLAVVAPQGGELARVQSGPAGSPSAQFSVRALRLAPYSGSVTGELPLAAEAIDRQLAAAYQNLHLVGEGPIRTDAYGAWEELPPSTIYYHVPTYAIAFTALATGRVIEGRTILLVQPTAGSRNGLEITLTAPVRPGKRLAPLSLGTSGPLSGPLRSLAISTG